MTMTKSPPSTCGAKVGLCFPRSRLATWLARRPRTTSVASTTYQSRWTSPGLGVYVRTVRNLFVCGVVGREASPDESGRCARESGWRPGRTSAREWARYRRRNTVTEHNDSKGYPAGSPGVKAKRHEDAAVRHDVHHVPRAAARTVAGRPDWCHRRGMTEETPATMPMPGPDTVAEGDTDQLPHEDTL